MFKMKKLVAVATATVMALSMTGIIASADENVIINDVIESGYDIIPLSTETTVKFSWYANPSDTSSTFAVPTFY